MLFKQLFPRVCVCVLTCVSFSPLSYTQQHNNKESLRLVQDNVSNKKFMKTMRLYESSEQLLISLELLSNTFVQGYFLELHLVVGLQPLGLPSVSLLIYAHHCKCYITTRKWGLADQVKYCHHNLLEFHFFHLFITNF